MSGHEIQQPISLPAEASGIVNNPSHPISIHAAFLDLSQSRPERRASACGGPSYWP
jgi:hypothetical protein